MIDHVSLPVANISEAGRFYDSVLAPLGYERLANQPRALGFGRGGALSPGFWLLERTTDVSAQSGLGLHIAFSAQSHESVHDFFETALSCGAKSAGAPGPRPEYSNLFYGAFVIDLEGFKVEAVCRGQPF